MQSLFLYIWAMKNPELPKEQKERLVALLDALIEVDFDEENSNKAKNYESR